MTPARRRLIIVVRADPVICGHAGEARNLAEAAARRGWDDVRILSWPIDHLETTGLPTKPIDRILPYSDPIVVERPSPVGDYKVPDARFATAMKGRLVELLIDGVPTVVLSMYLLPHTNIVTEAMAAALGTGLPVRARTIGEAVGSDITNIVRNCVDRRCYGPALYLFSTYLAQDVSAAVSQYTKELIIDAAQHVDRACGTSFAQRCAERVVVSYPAIDADAFTGVTSAASEQVWQQRQLKRDGYVLFLSRVAAAKGVDDLIRGYRSSRCYGKLPLIIAGNGPALREMQQLAAGDPSIRFLKDVSDAEKPAMMLGAAAYVLPSKPRPEFIETFGIALAEKLLVGGPGPVITTQTGGIPEAVADCALSVPVNAPNAIASALDHAVFDMSELERRALAERGRRHALKFDRDRVFEELMARLPSDEDWSASYPRQSGAKAISV